MLIVFAVLEALALRVRSIVRLMKPAKHMTRKHIIRILTILKLHSLRENPFMRPALCRPMPMCPETPSHTAGQVRSARSIEQNEEVEICDIKPKTMVRNAACPVDSGGLCLRPSAGSAITDGICGAGFGSGAQMRRDRRRPSAPGRSQAGAHWSRRFGDQALCFRQDIRPLYRQPGV